MRFRQAASEIEAAGINKVILDIRNNPGGILDQAVEIASYFLPKNNLVLIQEGSSGSERIEFKSRGYDGFQNVHVVILANQGSASASEILAGALRDNKNIKIIGEKTFGKGTVQELIPLEDGSVIKLTIARWLTPKNVSIGDSGIEPDIKVERNEADINENRDPQLDKAIEFLKNI